MTLHSPFCISARLCPALQIDKAWISYDKGQFIIDLPDGIEHKITDFHPGAGSDLPSQFADILAFLSACAESRAYGVRKNGDPMSGKNSDLFPENVGQWAESVSNELSMLALEIEEAENELIED